MISALQAFVITVSAYNIFTEGDFEFTYITEDMVAVSGYCGESTNVSLPSYGNGIVVAGVFQNCFKGSNIVSVSIPEHYTFVGESAFENCKSLESVIMPKDLSSIGRLAFYGCDLLESVDFSKVRYLSTIPLGIFWECKNLRELLLPKCVTKLDENICTNCTSLATVSLPDSITIIPEYAFYGCSSLETLVLPSSLKELGPYAFADCTALSSVDFPNTLTTIGEDCFENDTALTKLFIADSVTSIGANCFAPMSYSGSICVTCFEDSYAADYCYNNNVTDLILVKKVSGDCNLDGELNIRDTTLIQKYCAGLSAIDSAAARYLGDVNGDGSVTVRDATLIQMWLADIITEF